MWAIVTAEMVRQYCVPSYISDKLYIPSIIRYLMVLANVIPVIMMEYTISCREICYLINRLGIQISVLYSPHSCQLPNTAINFIHHAYVSSFTSQSWYKRRFYLSFSSSFSTCPFQTIIIFNPLLEHNVTGSQPDTSIHPEHVLFMARIFLHICQERTCPYPLPPKPKLEILLSCHSHGTDK